MLLYRRLRFGYPFRRIRLVQPKYVIVDQEDFEELNKYQWSSAKLSKTFYAVRFEPAEIGKRCNSLLMHRQIINPGKGMVVDHINRKGMDNRRANIRPATHMQNSYNRTKHSCPTYSKYKGVSLKKSNNKWFAQICVDGKNIWLGYFTDEIEAAKAYDRAARKYQGEFACPNFPGEKSPIDTADRSGCRRTLRKLYPVNPTATANPKVKESLRNTTYFDIIPADMVKQTRAYLYAAVAILFWSTSASAFKICLSPEHLNMSVPNLLFGASIVSSIALFVFLLFSRKLGLLKALSKEDYLRSAVLGFLNPFLYYTVLFKAYSILRAQEAQPLNFVWPLVLVLLSAPLLKQKIKRRDILAIFISFFGVFVISTEGRILSFELTDPLGVALATGSSIPWALFWIYNIKDKKDEALGMFLNFTFASVYVFGLLLLFGELKMPSLKGALGATYVGLFEMGITFLFWLKALKLSKTTAHVTSLIYLVPFLALVVIFFVLGEEILPSTIIGAFFIVGGIIFQKL